MKPEQRFYKSKVSPVLNRVPGLTHDRVETGSVSLGVPDVVYTRSRRTGFLEVKVSRTLKGLDLSEWRASQRTWSRRHVLCGATVFLLVECEFGDLLLPVDEDRPKSLWKLTEAQALDLADRGEAWWWNFDTAREVL